MDKLSAAIEDMRLALDGEGPCTLCKHYVQCLKQDCPNYIEGVGATGQETGYFYKDFKWTCMDIEYGKCPRLENTPCFTCDFTNNWEWRGL